VHFFNRNNSPLAIPVDNFSRWGEDAGVLRRERIDQEVDKLQVLRNRQKVYVDTGERSFAVEEGN
jgi:hypothetical protein